MDRLVYSIIAQYLGEYWTIKCLNKVCKSSNEHTQNNKIYAADAKSNKIGGIELCCKYNITDGIKHYLEKYSKNNHATTATYLARYGRLEQIIEFDLHAHQKPIIVQACKYGHIDILKYYHDNYGVHINDDCVLTAGYNRQHEILEYIYDNLDSKYSLKAHVTQLCMRGYGDTANICIERGYYSFRDLYDSFDVFIQKNSIIGAMTLLKLLDFDDDSFMNSFHERAVVHGSAEMNMATFHSLRCVEWWMDAIIEHQDPNVVGFLMDKFRIEVQQKHLDACKNADMYKYLYKRLYGADADSGTWVKK